VIVLRTPDIALHREWLDFMGEFAGSHIDGASADTVVLGTLGDPTAYRRWVVALLDHERGENLPDGRVACTTRWIDQDGEIVGTINLRHELTDYLLQVGGHIGYAVRPTARGRGVATAALQLILAEARRLGVNPVLVTCEADNTASARTIERCGGVLDEVREGHRRYWITLPDAPLGYAVRPLDYQPLRGRFVELRPVTEDLVARVKAGEVQADWAPDFPREDDLAGLAMHGQDGTPSQQWGSRLIVRRRDGLVVGTLGFYGPPDETGRVEIGYGLVPSARGEGLITDALALVVPAALATGATVQAHTEADNLASQAALVRAGFRATGQRNAAEEWHYLIERLGASA
jgi:predicted acetyltransferase